MVFRAATDLPLSSAVALLQPGTYDAPLAICRPAYHAYVQPIYCNNEPLTTLSLRMQTLTGPIFTPLTQRLEHVRLLFACTAAPDVLLRARPRSGGIAASIHLRHAVVRGVVVSASCLCTSGATSLPLSSFGAAI